MAPQHTIVTALSKNSQQLADSSIRDLSLVSPSFLSSSSQTLLLALPAVDDTTADSMMQPPPFSSVLDNLVLQKKSKKLIKQDVVVRVLDANTVKLERAGLVSFAAIQTPTPSYSTGAARPECMSFTPASKAKQLLPPKTKVGVVVLDQQQQRQSPVPRALIFILQDQRGNDVSTKLVNTELVRAGMAKPSPRGRDQAEQLLPGLTQQVELLQESAKTLKVGMYQTCDTPEFADDDQFEPLDRTIETQYFADGGKPVVKERRSSTSNTAPKNPGDTRGCSDFETYEEALSWFDLYKPWYGDVAKLDQNRDGVPCPGLPHTLNQDRYRMKIPDTNR